MKRATLIIIILQIAINISFAQWTGTFTSQPVSIANKGQTNTHIVTDGNSGAIITWEDNRNSATTGVDIYAQRMNNNGYPIWAYNGMVICNEPSTQKSVVITDAGNGACIIAWQDTRNGNSDIFAQKIDSLGNILWANNGVTVVAKTTTQKNPKIISDNAGGAIIVWEDSVNQYYDVYAQRINNVGVAQWTAGGVAICSAANLQLNPKIEIDALGGAIITWQDKRNGGDYDIYAQRVNASGATQWAANGIVVALALKTQHNPRIEPDGANGAYIAWEDKRNNTDYDIYAQHITATGTITWANNGVLVCGATGNQSGTDMKFLGNTIILAWKDNRTGSNQIYTQLVNTTGTMVLANNGILLSHNLKAINVNTVADGTGGSIITWQDSVANNWNIGAQKVNAQGTLLWGTNGIVAASSANNQINPAHVSDGAGGAIFAWESNSSGLDYDIYAQRIYSNGLFINGTKNNVDVNSNVSVYPNPVSTQALLEISNNEFTTIVIYTLNGYEIMSEIVSNNYTINATNYANGMYLYKLQNKDGSKIKHGKFVINKQ
jgi:hypothetical protein